MQIEATVSGIPCIARVTSYTHQAPMGPSAASDWDCYGYEEIEFELLDRREYPAAWLERKANKADRDRITAEISEAISKQPSYEED